MSIFETLAAEKGVKLPERFPGTSRFELVPAHVRLLRRSYFEFDGYEGFTLQNPKRPYGNSDIFGDVFEAVFGEEWYAYGERKEMPDAGMSEALCKRLKMLHADIAVVTQILVCSVGYGFDFMPGLYFRPSLYDMSIWLPEQYRGLPELGSPTVLGYDVRKGNLLADWEG